VNSAGHGSTRKPMAETTAEEFDNVLRSDLYGLFFCCPEFIRVAKRRAAMARSSTSRNWFCLGISDQGADCP